MKVSKKNSETNMFRMKGGGKTKIARKIAASGLAMLMVAELIFTNDLFGKDTSVVAMAAENDSIALESGLTGYYSFDGTLENEIGGGSASLHGGAGDTWNSAVVGSETYAAGKNDRAYSFSGDGAARGEGLELDVKTGTDFTISLWVNTSQKINFQPIIFTLKDGDNYITAGTNYNNFASGGIVNYKTVWSWLDRNNNSLSRLKDIPENTWVYVTLTMTDKGVATLYYNAEVLSTQTIANYESGYYANLPIFLGINWWNPSFKGLMDDVAVYNRALSAAEVKALYMNNGVPKAVESEVVAPSHVSVHDPSIIKEGDTYYIFGSHLAWAKSKDLIHWENFTNNINTNFKTLFAKEAEWAAMGDSTYTVDGNMWAPDIIWNPALNKWCMYMSINGCSWNSCICLLTADTLDGDWKYVGPVIYSGFTEANYNHDFSKTDYTTVTGETAVASRYIRYRNNVVYPYSCTGNDRKTPTAQTTWNTGYGAHAIDPCIVTDDDGNWYMSYGSWSGGIYMIDLDETTGLRDYKVEYDYVANEKDPYMGYHLAGGGGASGEASYIQKVGDYYYLYVTLGELASTGGYNMRVFRSEKLTGPYVDYTGDDARNQTTDYNSTIGNRVMSGYQWSYMPTGFVAQGHNSAFVEDGKAYVIYHTRFNNGTEGHEVRVHQMFLNEENWLVTAPFEYTGETLPDKGEVTSEDVAGAYEVLFHKLNIDYENLEVVKGEGLVLDKDGNVSGSRTGTWHFSESGSPYVTLELGSVTYKGVFVQQQKEDSFETTWCLTLLGSDEVSVWGYRLSDEEQIQYAQYVIDNFIMPTKRISDVQLPTTILNSSITWTSSNPEILSAEGKVTRPAQDTNVILTAEITIGNTSITKDFVVTVCSPEVVYFNDFYDFVGTAGNSTGWTSANASEDVLVDIDREEYGYYLRFKTNVGATGGRGIETDFGLGEKVTGNYTVEADVKLNQSNVQAPCFAIIGKDSVYGTDGKNNMNNNITSGYILKLQAAAINSDTYMVNDDSSLTVNIPSERWIHIKASVDESGNVSANINGTIINTKVKDSATLKGIYYLRGRGTANMSIDNIQVKTGTSITSVGSMNGNTPAQDMPWNTYNKFFKVETSEDFTVNWKFRNYNPNTNVWFNYAIAAISANSGSWYLRADDYSIETFSDSKVIYENNIPSDNLTAALNGAWIDATLVRKGKTMTFNASIKATDGNTYSRMVIVENVPLDDMAVYLGGENCYLEISDYSVVKEHHYEDSRQEPTCTKEGKVSGTCIYCSDKHEKTLQALGHKWDEGKVTEEASCDAEGVMTYTCTRKGCEETMTQSIPTIPHKEGEPVKENENPPTCTEKGSYDKVVKCSVCGEVLKRETIEIATIPHKEGEPVKENENPPTCTEKGSYDKVVKCSVCGEVLKRETIEIATIPHIEGEPTKENVTEASCTVAGSYDEVIRCSVCGEILSTITKEIAPLDHDWDEGIVTKVATCIEEGEKTYTCQREGCNVTKTEVIPLGKHTPNNEPTIIKEPTCTEEGMRTFECAVCGESGVMDSIEALGHDYGEWTVTIPATCTEKGEESRSCQREGCEAKETRAIDELGHDYGEWTVTTPATCTEKGEETRSCQREGCEAKETRAIDELGHDYGEWTVTTPATCTEKGEETRSCQREGCEAKETRAIDELGHDYGEWTVTTPATCTEKGEETRSCQREGCEAKETRAIDELGHDYGEWTVTTPATCTEKGEETRSCQREGCEAKETRAIDELGHNYGEWTVTTPATCTKEGEETRSCQREGCEAKETRATEALGHNYGEWTVTTPATCTKEGEETRSCQREGCEAKETRATEALGHNYGEWTVTTPATCTEKGEETRSCQREGCEAKETRIIDELGHTYSAPIFTWNSDDTATAEFTCTICGGKHSVDADMTVQTANSVTTYTASVKGEDGKTYTSTKRIIAIETAPDSDSDMRVVVAGAEEMEIPESLQKIEDLNTPEKITKKMENKINEVLREQLVIEEGESAEDFAFYDILLQISKDDGNKWETVTEENFPKEGITITLPYPEGTNKDDYDFVVAHMLTIDKDGFKPGDIELPSVTKTDAGIQFTVTSLSPIAVSWTKLEKVNPEPPSKEPESTTDPTQNPKPEEKPDKNVDTADSSRIFIWMLLCAVVGSGFIMLTTTRKNEKKAK